MSMAAVALAGLTMLTQFTSTNTLIQAMVQVSWSEANAAVIISNFR
jgi:hypothetical protein